MQTEEQTVLAFVVIALGVLLVISRASYWRGYAAGMQQTADPWQDALDSYTLVPNSLVENVSLVPNTFLADTTIIPRSSVEHPQNDNDDA